MTHKHVPSEYQKRKADLAALKVLQHGPSPNSIPQVVARVQALEKAAGMT